MPTFFARRYKRGKLSGAERVIGALILVVLALIVVAFLLTSGLVGDRLKDSALASGLKSALRISDEPLFQIDPAHLETAPADGKLAITRVTVVEPVGGKPDLTQTDEDKAGEKSTPVAEATKPSAPAMPPKSLMTIMVGPARFADLGDAAILAPVKTERYTDNLYEKIDGREGQFRAFHFVELRFGQYADTKNDQSFDVYIYDMAEPANAMGVYASERSGDIKSLDIGRDGYGSGTSVYFWKGKYYVYVLGPVEGDEAAGKISERIARAIADTIADDGQAFWADAILPGEDRVPNSLSYRATSALGYEFLNKMFVADYRQGEKAYQLYVIKTENPKAARALFLRFAESTAKYDNVIKRDDEPGNEMIVSEMLGVYSVAFCKGSYLAGVIECEDRELAEVKAKAFKELLPNP